MSKSTDQHTEFVDTIAARDARIAELEGMMEIAAAEYAGERRYREHLQVEVAAKDQALRTALHTLEAADGAWATDEPRLMDAPDRDGELSEWHPDSIWEPDHMRADRGTYHRQDFSAAIAKVKEALGE